MNYAATNVYNQLSQAEKQKMAYWHNRPLSPFMHPNVLREAMYYQQKAATIYAGLRDEANNHNAATMAQKAGVSYAQPQGVPVSVAVRPWLQQPAPQVQQSQPAQAQKSAVQKVAEAEAQLNRLMREAEARITQAVVRALGGGQQVQRSQAQPAQTPQLPISPVTGKPSQITAEIRRSLGLDSGGMLGQPQYYVEQQKQAQIRQSQAAYEGNPISPVTGRPSALTAQIRRSTGIVDGPQPGQVIHRGPGGSTLTYQPQAKPAPKPKQPAISPITGQPSNLTDMIRRSVGIVE